MITFKRGNIFNATEMAIINPVNTVGVSGAGLALAFKNHYPENYTLYKEACSEGRLRIGSALIHSINGAYAPYYILNVPTKKHWKDESTKEYVKAAIDVIYQCSVDMNLHSVALPPLGCGLGKLERSDVYPSMIEKYMGTDTHFVIYDIG